MRGQSEDTAGKVPSWQVTSKGFLAGVPSLEDCDDFPDGLSVQSTAADLRDTCTAGAEHLDGINHLGSYIPPTVRTGAVLPAKRTHRLCPSLVNGLFVCWYAVILNRLGHMTCM